MRKEKKHQEASCLCVVGTFTQAMQIQTILARANIKTEIIKSDGDGRHGCAYALSYPCQMEEEIRQTLRGSDIRVRFVRRFG